MFMFVCVCVCWNMCLHVHECADVHVGVCVCVCVCVCARESCSEEPLLAAASSRCCLLIPSLGQLSPHRRDQTRTMPVWQPPFSVLEPCGKGRPSAAELMKALLNSHSTKPCMSAVQSQAPSSCVSVSKPSGDLGVNHEGMSFLPNQMSRTFVARSVGKLAVFPYQDALVLYTWSLVLLLRFGL